MGTALLRWKARRLIFKLSFTFLTCIDLRDKDLEFFYKEQETRLRGLGVEPLPFRDLLCLIIDLVSPRDLKSISLGDLKNCKLQHIFYDTFLNAEKYLDR